MGAARIRFSGGPYGGRVMNYGPVLPSALYFQRCEGGRWRTYAYRLGPANIYHWVPDNLLKAAGTVRQDQEHPVGVVVGPADPCTVATGDELAAVDGDMESDDVRVS